MVIWGHNRYYVSLLLIALLYFILFYGGRCTPMGHGNCLCPLRCFLLVLSALQKGPRVWGFQGRIRRLRSLWNDDCMTENGFNFSGSGFPWACNKCVIAWGKGVAYLTMSGGSR